MNNAGNGFHHPRRPVGYAGRAGECQGFGGFLILRSGGSRVSKEEEAWIVRASRRRSQAGKGLLLAPPQHEERCLPLTLPAQERRSSRLHDAFDNPRAGWIWAGVILAVIDLEAMLEIAKRAVCMGEIAQG
jgi:hypothetical protein